MASFLPPSPCQGSPCLFFSLHPPHLLALCPRGSEELLGSSSTSIGQNGAHTREAGRAPCITEPWASVCAPHGEKGALIRQALHPSLAGCLGL